MTGRSSTWVKRSFHVIGELDGKFAIRQDCEDDSPGRRQEPK